MSSSDTVSDALKTITTDAPSYQELTTIYQDLSADVPRNPTTAVSQRALAHVVGELLDYLDFVAADLEKSVGISRTAERERILAALEEPRGTDSVERVHRLIQQWDALERYNREGIVSSL